MLTVSGFGRLVSDPEVVNVGETTLCRFTLAVDEQRKLKNGEKKKITSFFDCQAWDRGGEVIAQYCKKGDLLFVVATPRQDKWETEDGQKRSKVFFRVNEFKLLPSRQKKDEEHAANDEPVAAAAEEATVTPF